MKTDEVNLTLTRYQLDFLYALLEEHKEKDLEMYPQDDKSELWGNEDQVLVEGLQLYLLMKHRGYQEESLDK